MKTFEQHHDIWLPRPLSEVFTFFADASNLSSLTPDWLAFRIVTPSPVKMTTGTRIDYRIRLRGVPMRWTSLISRWEPPHLFVDEQVRGPYRSWIHTHRFESQNGGTLVSDHVSYAVWGGSLVNRWFVEPDLERIFRFRRNRLLERFEETAEYFHAS